MNELQSEDLAVEETPVIENNEVEQPIEENANPEGAELAPASDSEHEEKPEGDHSQEKIQKVINKKHFEAREAERKAAEWQQKFEALQAQHAPTEPEKPTLPDPFDDDYESKMQQYNDKMRNRIAWEESQRIQKQQAEHAQAQRQMQVLTEVQNKVNTYADRAEQLGVSKEQLALAGQQVAAYQLNNEVAAFLLDDAEGPLITTHLAANHQELDSISRMTPIQAAMYIQTQVKPKLQKLKPRETNAPKPPTNISPTVSDPELGKYKFIGNAKFE